MQTLLPDIRPTVRALIIRNDHVLLLRKSDVGAGERFALPGGGQSVGESLPQALVRECTEEIGVAVKVGPLLHVAEFMKTRRSVPTTRRHVVDFLYACEVPADYEPRNGTKPDKSQLEVCWVALAEIPRLRLDPEYLGRTGVLHKSLDAVYLGHFDG